MKSLNSLRKIQETLECYALNHTWFMLMANVGLPLIALVTLLLLAYHPWVISGIVVVLFSGYVFIGFCNILVLLKRKQEKKCGICGDTATVGPMAGGPIEYYCDNCHTIIRTFLKAEQAHQIFIKELKEGKQ